MAFPLAGMRPQTTEQKHNYRELRFSLSVFKYSALLISREINMKQPVVTKGPVQTTEDSNGWCRLYCHMLPYRGSRASWVRSQARAVWHVPFIPELQKSRCVLPGFLQVWYTQSSLVWEIWKLDLCGIADSLTTAWYYQRHGANHNFSVKGIYVRNNGKDTAKGKQQPSKQQKCGDVFLCCNAMLTRIPSLVYRSFNIWTPDTSLLLIFISMCIDA